MASNGKLTRDYHLLLISINDTNRNITDDVIIWMYFSFYIEISSKIKQQQQQQRREYSFDFRLN